MRRLNPARVRSFWVRLPARCRGLRSDSGNALIELAMIFAFLGIPMLWGTTQTGILVYDSIEVSNAANAGALFAAYTQGHATLTSSIVSAAQADAPDFPNTRMGNSALTVTSSTFYYCAEAVGGTNTQYTTAAAATAACGAAGTPNESLQLVQVSTSATVTPILRFPGVPSSFTVKGNAVLAVQP